MKILKPFTGTGAIFFPIGKPPEGTCEFATLSCTKHCYASLPDWPDFDEQIIIPEEEKKEIYKIFMETPVWWLVEEVERELDGLQTDILHWFGSGDCPESNTARILELVAAFGDLPIIQIGFTRNENLWRQRPDIFALTVEDENETNRDGMFSVPDYINGTSKMFFRGRQTRGGLCGPELCQDRIEQSLVHFINCQTCRRLNTGCFDRRINIV